MARGQFGGGEGAYDNPFLIEDSADLHAMRLFPNKYYKLVYDINLGHTPFTDNNGWKPISDFTGQLDGNGKTIHNLFINTTESYVGLFDKYNYPAKVKDLSFKSANITGGSFVGVVFGDMTNTNNNTMASHVLLALENISVSGRVRAMGDYAGAITGRIRYHNGLQTGSSASGVIYTWTAFKNIFTDVNLIKMDETSDYVSGVFGSVQGVQINNNNYGGRYHYYAVAGSNVINCGNFSVSGNNNGRTNPIFTMEGYSNGLSITTTYVNIDSWRKNVRVTLVPDGEDIITEIPYTDNSIALTGEAVKDKASYAAALVNAVNEEGLLVWQFEAAKDVYPRLYFSGSDMAFIKLDDGLYVYENDNWVKKFSEIPDIEDAETAAMTSLKDIPAEAWEKLKTLSNSPVLINIAKKQSTYYTGNKTLKATAMTNFGTDNKKVYRRSVNFFEFADGIFNIQTTK